MKVSEKRIVIVGASSGLGLLMAESFASMGWKVGAAARTERPLVSLKEKNQENVEWMSIDVNSDDAAERLEKLISKTGGMDVYLHVAGICIENPSLASADEIRTVDTNVGGFTRLIDEAFNYFRHNNGGHIAAITSVAGTKGLADLPSYSASKRYQWIYLNALDQLSKREKLNIRFTDIRPGWTRTPLIDPNRRYLMAMEPEKVARSAVKAILAGKRVAYIDSRWSVMTLLWRLLPQSIWRTIPLRASSVPKEI